MIRPVGLFVVLLPLLTGADRGPSPSAHPLHLSTAQLVVEPSAAYLRIRMFKDDLEETLAAYTGLGDLQLAPTGQIDSLFLEYFTQNFELRADGSLLGAELISSGEDLESGQGETRMWWYLLGFEAPHPIVEIELLNRVLFDRFDDQRNVVRVLHSATDARRTLYFAAPDDEPAIVRFD